MKYFSENRGAINALEIRTSTDFREALAIRRYFYHPLRSQKYPPDYYYDFAIIELGKQTKHTILLH